MATKYSKKHPDNAVSSLLKSQVSLQQYPLGQKLLMVHSENYWLKGCYHPKPQEIIDYRPVSLRSQRRIKIWHRCQNWQFRFAPLLQVALMKVQNFQVMENYSDELFLDEPIVFIKFQNTSIQVLFKLYYPQCGH